LAVPTKIRHRPPPKRIVGHLDGMGQSVEKLQIVTATLPRQFQAAAVLFRQYADSLGFDLDFQDFEGELADLPSMYGPPEGCLLLAVTREGPPLGCVALRRLENDVCEMKRLYVTPVFQGRGLGRRLAEAIIAEARRLGYAVMRLDTVVEMTAANALYDSLGFRPIAPYRYNPLETAAYYELPL